MGHGMPPIFGASGDCILCTPLLWGIGETPEYLAVIFAGLTKCNVLFPDLPAGNRFILKNTPGFLCDWDFSSASFRVGWAAAELATKTACSLAVWYAVGAKWLQYFIAHEVPKCQLEVNNTVFCGGGPNDGATGGTATIQWGPDIGELEYNAQ